MQDFSQNAQDFINKMEIVDKCLSDSKLVQQQDNDKRNELCRSIVVTLTKRDKFEEMSKMFFPLITSALGGGGSRSPGESLG